MNPATGETVRVFSPLTPAELEAKLECARKAFQSQRQTTVGRRAEKMLAAASILDAEKDRFGRIITLEMGKPLAASIEEVEKCAAGCRYFAEHAERFLADERLEGGGFVRYLPLGAVLAIMPWNYPFWQVFRFAAPALMAGNVGLLKHAENVPQCALAIEEIFRRAGFVEGCFQTLLIEVEAIAGVIEDPRVVAVTLTGSERAGCAVAAQAGKALKRTVLELGGSDPFIVMPSADLSDAVRVGVTARTMNSGQSCICAKRFIVHAAVYEEFLRKFVDRMAALKVGDPLDPETDIGPLVSARALQNLEDQVARAVAAGARVVTGGRAVDRVGYYFAPTVLTGVPRSSAVYREEFFGPVAMLFEARDIEDAIAIANDSPFGLGSSVWTRDAGEQERFVNELEVGMTFVNSMSASRPGLPFGGVKRSGYGRELSRAGMMEFVNAKSVWVAK